MEWSEEQLVRLIQLYENEAVLWNTKLLDYRKKDKKNDAWNKIANALEVERIEVERKSKVLLAQYRREKLKYKKK